jgi:hypothetical protein
MLSKSSILAFLSFFSLCTVACSSTDPTGTTGTEDEELRRGRACIYDGHRHRLGESFPSSDGCNTCTCTSRGVICTERACAIDAGSANGCVYDGKTYKDGDSFPSSDGCNACACNAGSVICTARACQLDCSAKGACGPAPGMPNWLCADGSTGGPVCEPVNGTCGWQIHQCECKDASGASHKPGETWSDGCNTCACDQQGYAACTARACACPPNGTVNCMPPNGSALCSGPYHQWVEQNCPGVSFVY